MIDSTSQINTSGTYNNQPSLPRLPLPSLDETLDKFLNVVEPITDVEAAKLDENFRNNDGPKLQALLEEYAKDKLSYVEEFWSDAYLVPDDRVVLNLNPFFVLEDHPDAKVASCQISRAASLVYASLKFASMLKNETLPPDYMRGTPLCMDQFKALFGSCRIPMENTRDHVENYPESSHIVVFHRCQVYYFQVLNQDGSLAVNQYDIEAILKAIVKNSDHMSPKDASKSALGILTTLKRTKWSMLRKKLVESSVANKKSLDVIDQALFILALDDSKPNDIHEMAANMLHGSYQLSNEGEDLESFQKGTSLNRWYDKLQLIVCKDGSAGVNFEHSSIDGHTALRFVSDIFAETIVSFAQSITKSIYGNTDKVPSVLTAAVKPKGYTTDTYPKHIDFHLPPEILKGIYHAEVAVSDEICGLDSRVLEFQEFGKTYITSKKLSPDSFVQMSIILSYYRLYGEIACSYEPVLTKRFVHGRTEAMRSTTVAAKTLCEAFTRQDASKEEKINALREAVQNHSALVREAANGKGVDRHLYALKCIAEKNSMKVPDFFSSEAWKTLNHTIISTSNCGNPALRLFGFGPVVPDGFGIGYIIKDTCISYAITSKHRQTMRFVHTLRQTLILLQEMLGATEILRVSSQAVPTPSKPPETATKDEPKSPRYLDEYDLYGESSTVPKLNIKQTVPAQQDSADSFGPLANITPRRSIALNDIGVVLSKK